MRVGLPRHQRQRPRPSLGGRSPHLHQLWTRAVPQPVRMGCNMCVVQKPEDQYRVMFQVKELSRLSRDPAQDLQDPLLASIRRRGVRKRAGLASRGGLVTMGVADCVDGCTQTDISFQNLLAPGRSGRHPCGAPPPPDPPPSPPLPPEPYLFDDLFPEPVYYDPNDYFDAAQHEVDRQDELEYEEVELYKSRQQDKLGLTVCYRTDEEEDLGIYVGEVNPHGIAAIDGRIRKGDRILQINGLDVEDREEAVAILTREDSTNISLLLARPETESDTQLDAEEPDLELRDSSHPLVRKSASGLGVGPGSVDRQHTETSRDSPDLLQTVLSNSQELDSGVGRTDESTRNEESSEHDLLGDDHTSASNTNATNTPGSMRRFFSASLLPSQELRFSTDSLLGLDCLGLDPRDQPEKPYARDAVRMAMPGLTEQECERYKELLEIKCYYERSSTLEGGQGSTREEEEEEEGGGGGGVSLDVNRNEKLWPHELALLEEELRHLEFKCRNVLRAQKMQQLRERCRKAWPLEDKSMGTGTGLDIHAALGRPESCEHALSDINELPERERYEKDGTSAYNTGGGSCRSSALANQSFRPSSSQRDGAGAAGGGGGRANLNHTCSPPRNAAEVGSKVRSQSRDAGGRQGTEERRHPKERSGGAGADSSPYLAHRPARTRPPRRYLSCTQLRSPSPARDGDPDPEGGASPMSLGSTYEDGCQASADLLLAFPAPVPPASPRMEWKVKIRSDGSRYVAKRPVRDRLLKARAMKIREERSGTTTDDDAVSEMKMGRYWSKEERKQQLLRAREQRRRRELMVQSRLDLLRVQGGQQEAASILELWHRRSTKKRSRRILDNWITIQELLAHGSRSADGKKVYNPLLSVTTV